MSARLSNGWSAVVDASVVIEYLVGLSYVEQATRVFRRLVDEPDVMLWAPDLVYPECVSVLRKLVALKRVTRAKARERVTQLQNLPLTIGSSRVLAGESFALTGALTAYDAMYVALANRVGAPLITADAKLARALAGLRSDVLMLSAC